MSQQKDVVKEALREDIGKSDLTSELIIPAEKNVNAIIITRQACIVCGLDIAKQVFKTQDKKIGFIPLARDGQYLKKDALLARVQGKANSILTAERVALNFLTLLSGIATNTYEFVKAVQPYRVKILDTRKTIPGLRKLQKYAVRIGGGQNHRMSLSDMVLIKDNHIKITGSVRSAAQPPRRGPGNQTANIRKIIEEAQKKAGKKVKIEIEVKNLREFKEALKAAPDIIMLDNMKVPQMKKAVQILHAIPYAVRRTLIEASGGITLRNVNKVASTGINLISVGTLTHSVKSIDMSLEIL